MLCRTRVKLETKIVLYYVCNYIVFIAVEVSSMHIGFVISVAVIDISAIAILYPESYIVVLL